MSKKIPLILIVSLLGLLSAGTMWFMRWGTGSPMFGGVHMDQSKPMMGNFGSAEIGMMQGGMDRYTTSVATMTAPYYPYPGDALDVTSRSIQKYAYHSVVVTNVDEYMRSMREYFQSVGGIVLSYNQGTSQNDYLYGNLTAKVPQEKFDEAVLRVTENVNKVVTASVDVQDVTGEVVAVADQLQQLQDMKAEQELELEEATTAADRRRVQLEIDRLDRQILQLQQSQENVSERVEYATLNITVSNREHYFTGNGPRPLGDVLREAWYSLRGAGFGVLYFLIWVAVYAIIWVPVLLLARWIWGKVRAAAPKS